MTQLPTIDAYSFGSIVIGDEKHTSDVIIYPDGQVEGSWRRAKGHRLSVEDISPLIESKPDAIVAGTGAYGMMKPDQELVKLLYDRGIEFRVMKSKKATEEYNRLKGEKNVGACFHLTC